MKQRIFNRSAILILLLTGIFLHAQAYAESCGKVVHAVNVRLTP